MHNTALTELIASVERAIEGRAASLTEPGDDYAVETVALGTSSGTPTPTRVLSDEC